tara:strand:+ start:2354 stop:2593 length:240 start_codon:yes stop_codon:yes gene_type:complete
MGRLEARGLPGMDGFRVEQIVGVLMGCIGRICILEGIMISDQEGIRFLLEGMIRGCLGGRGCCDRIDSIMEGIGGDRIS